ncbi:hypothetical protein Q73_10540 [Bacillus coahuilensis m2-6]|nr:hypothetical protein Q73_10540 [Bacillus coahuilensis m2-6]
MILIYIVSPMSVSAYSYGDPSEEAIAEAYKELDAHVEQGNWENVKEIYEAHKKDFNLYFTNVQSDLEAGIESENGDVVLRSWQAALRLNIERRLHFAEEQFDDYGQAKLLLAKARGTYSVLEPLVVEQKDQQTSDNIYQAFDEALTALGNPGLFGIGSQENDPVVFQTNIEFILNEITPMFPIVSEVNDDHLTEENLDILSNWNEAGGSSFWLWLSVGLIAFLLIMILLNKRKQKKSS